MEDNTANKKLYALHMISLITYTLKASHYRYKRLKKTSDVDLHNVNVEEFLSHH